MLTYPHEGAGWCKSSSGSAEHIEKDNGFRGVLSEKRAESLGEILDGEAVCLYLYAGCSLLYRPLEFYVVVYEKIGEGVTNLSCKTSTLLLLSETSEQGDRDIKC